MVARRYCCGLTGCIWILCCTKVFAPVPLVERKKTIPADEIIDRLHDGDDLMFSTMTPPDVTTPDTTTRVKRSSKSEAYVEEYSTGPNNAMLPVHCHDSMLQIIFMPNAWFLGLIIILLRWLYDKYKKGECLKFLMDWMENHCCSANACSDDSASLAKGGDVSDVESEHETGIMDGFEIVHCQANESFENPLNEKLGASPMMTEDNDIASRRSPPYFNTAMEVVERCFSSLETTSVEVDRSFIKYFGRHFGLQEMVLTKCDERADGMVDFLVKVLKKIQNELGSGLDAEEIVEFLLTNGQVLLGQMLQEKLTNAGFFASFEPFHSHHYV